MLSKTVSIYFIIVRIGPGTEPLDKSKILYVKFW